MMSQDNPIKFKCLQPTNKKNVHALTYIMHLLLLTPIPPSPRETKNENENNTKKTK